MVPLRGWGPRGQRLRAKVPHRRWKTMTLFAALRHDRVDAPWLAFGFSAHGSQLGPVVGRIIAELFSGEPQSLSIEAFDIARFGPGQ